MVSRSLKVLTLTCLVVSGCAHDAPARWRPASTDVASPRRTAFVGLQVTTRYHVVDASGDVLDIVPIRFFSSDSMLRSPFAGCTSRSQEVRALARSSSWGRRASRPAATLREAYAACRMGGDLKAMAPVRDGFGVERSRAFHDALLDSLTMLAHEFARQSLLKALYRETHLGTVLPPEVTAFEMRRAGHPGLRQSLMQTVEREANAPVEDVVRACTASNVEALLFVAIEHDEVVWLGEANSFAPEKRPLRVDVLVLSPPLGPEPRRLRFLHQDATPLAAWTQLGDALLRELAPAPLRKPPPHPWAW